MAILIIPDLLCKWHHRSGHSTGYYSTTTYWPDMWSALLPSHQTVLDAWWHLVWSFDVWSRCVWCFQKGGGGCWS